MARPSEGFTESTSSPRCVCVRACARNISFMAFSILLKASYFFFQVELFGVTANETEQESQQLLEEIIDLQKEICAELGFHYR